MGCLASLDGRRCSAAWLVSSSAGAGAGSIAAAGSCATMVWSPSDRMARDPASGSGHSSVSSYACQSERLVSLALFVTLATRDDHMVLSYLSC